MATVSSIPTFLDALKAALVIRAGLTGVNIFTGPVDPESEGPEAIVFGAEAIETTTEFPTVPRLECWETYILTGRIWVAKPGAGETVIKAARDRAFALLEQVHDELATNDEMTATVTDVRPVGWRLEQGIVENERQCRITFSLRVEARFTPA